MSTTTTLRPAAGEAEQPPTADPTATPPRPRRRPQRSAYLFLLPWILGAVLLTIGPMVTSLYLSFTDYDLFSSPSWVGFDNYQRLFTEDPRFWASVRVTLTYVLVSVPLQLAIALGVALLLNRPRRGIGFYRSALYAPSLLGASISLALAWKALFSTGGTVPNLLASIGLDTGGWTDDPDLAIYAVVALTLWQFGAPMVIFLAGLKQIPRDLYEAAALDGAGKVRQFFSVTLPMLTPVLLFNLVLGIIHAFQSFTGPYVISNGRGGPGDSTLVYTLYLYQRGFTDFRMGTASAMAWLLLLAIAVVTALLFATSRRWVFYAGEEN
ncbi:carbohydrate ABC transporter permease [Nocardioides bruguierae]|uniref:Sugar ABC transporter permease n=1 Tax=Nocardioides bruguierae TaxID=2945102 RepID=A0A9X2DCB3_9ACTN|nr:sugar ABC transporter permease [Nocardioides bruguierae]MCM0622772.1 sugar ABC transporter permease [Nocardioides bruguierae]